MIALAEPWIEGFGWLVSDGAAVFFAKWEDGSILDEAPPPAVKRVEEGKEKEKNNEKEEDKEENKEDLKEAAAGDTELSDVELLQAELQLACEFIEENAFNYFGSVWLKYWLANVFVSKQPFEKLMHLSLREEGAAVWQRGSKREGDGGKEEKEEEEGEDDDEDDDEKKEEEYEYE
ncbi:uncharacterized protein MONOS_7546 [Monocercomonoides exilis]|uniref:uncharacterized protein n=1 Tax=Monocercomonoides exilis TaxID=2049356 RepID=UPI00355AB989|nr:hypothetical protein MONOS_7546 [Monocercomonoides exilis]|eukprot:MONOS_7546.1-p1 / transcript=MONOS_7546.1 / gene=MONOS_7546 / organism=Monocercomonoides_exilis_PA203 / gene_product=unspecified product / transcript_product=unspecified product / location=Mono_scaffold00260:28600-29342(+) / protein_length=176 / sequence_SO=supercontig / SO=protein_coding / is_pseudo=false